MCCIINIMSYIYIYIYIYGIMYSRCCQNINNRYVAHLGHGTLKILGNIVAHMPSFTTKHHGVCKGCVLGKYASEPFPKSDSRSKGILNLIHNDICGPMSSLSIGGKFRYYITFIDDFSRKTWIYFLT
jgi:hypothetical protein